MYKIANYNHCSSKLLGFLDRILLSIGKYIYIPRIAGSSSPHIYPEPFKI